MNILVITSRVPYPLHDGGAIATYNQVKSYAALGHRVTMCCLNTRKHFVSAATIRHAFDFAAEVITVEADTNIKPLPALRSLLDGTSYNIVRFDQAAMHRELKKICVGKSFDLIQLEGLFTAPYIETLRKISRAPLLLRQHNVEFRIWEKLAAHTPQFLKRQYLKLLARRLKAYELARLPLVNTVAAITEEDAVDLKALCPAARVITARAGIDIPVSVYPGNPLAVYHLGSMEWMPNRAGISWFLKEVWPMIIKCEPKATLHLAGKGLETDFGHPLPSGVENSGEVEDAAQWYAPFGISIVPLMAGSGVRMKTLEALAAGKNVVSTSTGAAGLPLTHGKEVLLADDPEAFAKAVLRLMHDEVLRLSLREQGRKLAARYNRIELARELLIHATQIQTYSINP